MIKLVPIDAVRASEYNPRRNDEKRLALTELSLRKLGFLLPIYADESGEILSGHQRHLVASRMGFRQIPVEYVSGKTLGERRAVNVLFNRATNDLQKQDTCAIIRRRLYEMDIEAMTGELPDIEPGTEASFPCVYALRRMDVVKLAKLNHRSFDTHIKQLAKSLERHAGSHRRGWERHQRDRPPASSSGGRKKGHRLRQGEAGARGFRVLHAQPVIHGL